MNHLCFLLTAQFQNFTMYPAIDIWHSYSGEDVDVVLLGCNATCRCRQYVSPQHRYYAPTGPHGDTTQTNIDNTAIIASTSNFVVVKSILLKQQLKNYEMGWPVVIW
jgi:hypothetical protein